MKTLGREPYELGWGILAVSLGVRFQNELLLSSDLSLELN